ncbi:MAG: bifunctional folylpolyglutamate synthase/dihydrofolate synthase [Clostridia bacterium]|nr:bifunctional folylpolyglutamate synthase/dihydrofolate synthase [Clostridia bacterium]
MISYEQALNYIHARKAHSAKPGLHRIAALLEQLGNPQKGLPFLHIAGTNGKGSTATMLASVLQAAGYKVGCFTSPFIYDFRERFAINGRLISEEQLARLAVQVQAAEQTLTREGMEPLTEFEVVTAIGFLYFKEENCDITVLEVGLGGRFDATNIIDQPLLSVLCSISLDHTEFLGDTIEQIAFEKAGIIKKNCPVVLYNRNPADAIDVIRAQCIAKNAPLTMGEQPKEISLHEDGSTFLYKGTSYSLSLRGEHQIYNAITAIEALYQIRNQFPFTEEQLQKGLQQAHIPARLECIHSEPFIFIDGGHNREGIDALVKAMDTIDALKEPVVIFGMMRDKPYQYAVQKLAMRAKAFLAVQPPLPRAMTAFDLKNMADLFCDDCTACDSYSQAAKLAKEKCNRSILVAGSLYLTGDMAKELKKLF